MHNRQHYARLADFEYNQLMQPVNCSRHREPTHIVLPTIGSAGDVLPVIGLGRALQQRGHRVTVLTNPYFQAMVAAAGLELAPVGSVEEFRRGLEDPNLWHPLEGFQTIVRRAILPAMPIMYDYLATLDPKQTIVAAAGMCFGARIAQEKFGFPLITVHLQPTLFMSAYDVVEMGGFRFPGWMPLRFRQAYIRFLEERVTDRLLAPSVNAFRAELGLAPVARIFGRWMHSPQRVLGLFPTWFAPPQPDWPPNLLQPGFVDSPSDVGEGAALTPELAAFLAAGDPPIVFTPGSAMQYGDSFFRAAIAASRQLGRRAILLTRFRTQLPATLPPDLLHVEWAPLAALLPSAAAIVYHGGIGTLAQALAAGIPQLVIPFAHDQPDNANRLQRLGVAARMNPSKVTADRLAQQLRWLLDASAVQARCRELAALVDFERALADACAAIETVGETQQ